ncbi:hypothetical protein ACFS07_11190 [Undibacterium arcticum]
MPSSISCRACFSPYQTNPLNINPLRDMLNAQIDFPRLRQKSPVKLFHLRHQRQERACQGVQKNAELSCDVLLASSCLPFFYSKR